ncbi:putative ubiquitin-conjugating enzyme E2 38 [Asparagus officinalis]|uniref:putative ubiquitin-conjugating enzyme E2 38 n=1 Tax=Asparagus officinalis TaxID=4686 RepID=UPI00098E3BC9|nr:putative ubiquitin-conjugating enzyme E2 38 [Asparagus officinalis]
MDVNPNHHHSCGSSSSKSNQSKRQHNDGGSNDLMDKRCIPFKQFDVVTDFSDHHFSMNYKEVPKPSNTAMKKIQQDWQILEKDLPEAIFVRVYEERMDLLRAVIIGPAGTPYHDGLFFFDFQFTANYPNEPPKAYYRSGGLRLNPNLYADGTVCLSLLNTWYGKGCEKWDPKRSTMLQILVSIQGLVLNAKPYYNEPISWPSVTPWGKKGAFAYNESAFLLSCRTMIYSLRKPPLHFKEFVADHFQRHGLSILMECRAYSHGIQVGCAVDESDQAVSKKMKGSSEDFKVNVKKLIDELLKEFTAKGVDCRQFQMLKAEVGETSASVSATRKNETEADSKKKAKPGETSTSGKEARSTINLEKLKPVATQHMKKAAGADVKGKAKAGDPKEANGKVKRFCQYLLKLGKKVLPLEN